MTSIIDIAESVVSELNAHGFAMSFVAARAYQPVYDLADMGVLHVTVVPRGQEIVQAGRGLVQADFTVDVAVQVKPADLGNATLDALMALVREIQSFFQGRGLVGLLSPARWIATANLPIYVPDHLKNQRQFSSATSFTFRVIEAMEGSP